MTNAAVSDRTQPLFGKTVLVTGANGFLGSALTSKLSQNGALVRAMIRRPQRSSRIKHIAGISIVEADLTHELSLHEAVKDVEIVFHVAAALEGPLPHQRQVNVEGTRALAKASAHAGVKRFVHVSTIAVYGFNVRGIVTEESAQKPGRSAYNLTKSEAETALIRVADQHTLPISIVRPGMIYGPGSRAWTKTMFRMARIRPIPFPGSGRGHAHPIFVDDVVDLLVHCAHDPQAEGEAFHCTPDPAPTWRQFLLAYAALAGHQQWLSVPLFAARWAAMLAEAFFMIRRNAQDAHQLVDYINSPVTYSMEKARRLLSWTAYVSLDDGIQRCIPYLRECKLLS